MRALLLFALVTAILAAGPICHADRLVKKDGTILDGRIVAIKLRTADGLVHEVPAGAIRSLKRKKRSRPKSVDPAARAARSIRRSSPYARTSSPYKRSASAPPRRAWSTGGRGAPRRRKRKTASRSVLFPRVSSRLLKKRVRVRGDLPYIHLELTYRGGETSDPGGAAEVFAFKDGDRRNRKKWIRLGYASRVSFRKKRRVSAALGGALLDRIFDKNKNRAANKKRAEARMQNYDVRMVYRYSKPVRLRPGPWSIYVNFRKIRRHRIWPYVSLSRGYKETLRYHWTKHNDFGR